MSGFDKEAERERLRQQFEKDEASRKETARMSELLLKGATMTNKHCEVCGDPIFRYQGQEFCATCEGREQDAAAQQAEQPAAQATPEQAEDTANGEHPVETEAAEAKAREAQSAQSETDSPPTPEPAPAPTPDAQPPAQEPAPTPQAAESAMDNLGKQATEVARTPAPTQSSHAQPSQSTPSQSATGSDLAAAQQSLVRTLTKLTTAAEESDDVGRTKEYLEAAHEAAEALRAVKKASR
ncbi:MULTISPECIES: Sjogren's syndrome/scleroderma autoantigen 1 family protein [unclassified Haladaptatus]|uniref:Sjogren's syndrome/scleroderma autoantigen 1 family protein n=1 Tax=unclassified Haladaptatus TaxID=2622732 RepID=UPI0023E811D2|nr:MULTISPECIES: Sjogren's syndrome/scleroderma autoantigen 1 family protein [unclassified Haladaptatus]